MDQILYVGAGSLLSPLSAGQVADVEELAADLKISNFPVTSR
jgi:hypothetical protein